MHKVISTKVQSKTYFETKQVKIDKKEQTLKAFLKKKKKTKTKTKQQNHARMKT